MVGLNQLRAIVSFRLAVETPKSPLRDWIVSTTHASYLVAAMLWAGVGASFFISNPAGIGSFIIILLPVAQSLLAMRAIHHKVERLEAKGGA